MSGLEVPVHVSGFLFLASFIGVEASPALIAGLAKFFVEIEDEMRSGSDDDVLAKIADRRKA